MGLLDIFSSIKDRADRFLSEKNVVTDFLGKVEEKTGIRKKIIAAGRWAVLSIRTASCRVNGPKEDSANPPVSMTAAAVCTCRPFWIS